MIYGLQRTVVSAAGGKASDWLPIKEFYAWAEVLDQPKPPSAAGAALIELVERELHEDFWLDGPWFDDLMSQGKDNKPPSKLCLTSSDAILLAPYRASSDQWAGFLIAKPTASGKILEFTALELDGDSINTGECIKLQVSADSVNAKGFGSSKAGAILSIV